MSMLLTHHMKLAIYPNPNPTSLGTLQSYCPAPGAAAPPLFIHPNQLPRFACFLAASFVSSVSFTSLRGRILLPIITAPPAPARESRSPLDVTLRGGEDGLETSAAESCCSVEGLEIMLLRGLENLLSRWAAFSLLGASVAGVVSLMEATVGTVEPEGMRLPSGCGVAKKLLR